MKKSIVMTLIFALFLSVASCVNAAVEVVPVTASVVASETEAATGDEVTVTVSLLKDGVAQNIDMADVAVTYDPTVLEYVANSTGARYEKVEGKKVTAQYFAIGKTSLTFKFKVIGEKGTESPVTFEAVQITSTGVEYKVESASTTVKVPGEEEPEENTTTEENTTEPTEPEHKDPTGTGSETEEPEVDENGKPTKIPQTGVNFAVVGGVVIALVAVAAVAKKIND